MPTTAPGRKYASPSSVRESRAIQAAARVMGLRPGTVGQLVRTRGIHIQTAQLIDAALLMQDDALFLRLTHPLLAAMERRVVPSFNALLVNEVQQADLAEDQAEAHFLARPSPDTRRAWLARLRQQHVLAGDLIRSLEAEDAK